MAMAAAMAASPKPGELRSFEDWAIGCDNGRACKAVSLMEMESGENQLTVQILRGPLADDSAQLRINNIEQRDPGGTVTFILDGTSTVATVRLPENNDGISLRLTPALASVLRNGRTIELRNSLGASLGSASLRGLSAALSYMDRVQVRASTVTALVAAGPQPATLVPRAPALPSVVPTRFAKMGSLTLSASDVAGLQARTGCDASGLPPLPLDAVRIDGRNWLALIPCASGAYNFMAAPILLSGSGKGRRMRPASFDFTPGFSPTDGTPLIANPSWDPAKGELSSFAKGRGLGDCGSAETYAWDGRRFRLITQVAMAECRGVIDWIPTWRVTVSRK